MPRQSNTMSEGIPELIGKIAELKTTPDADLEFLTNLETYILGYRQQQQQQLMQQLPPGGTAGIGQGPPQSPPPGPTPGGLPGPPPGPPPMPPGILPGNPGGGVPQQIPGVSQGPQMPNMDEMRRMIGKG